VLSLLIAVGLPSTAFASEPSLWRAIGSPWWEQYDIRETYRCPGQGTLVVERNDSQASLLSGRYRTTLFREASEAPGLRFLNGRQRLILRGDELTLEELPQRLICIRTEEV